MGGCPIGLTLLRVPAVRRCERCCPTAVATCAELQPDTVSTPVIMDGDDGDHALRHR